MPSFRTSIYVGLIAFASLGPTRAWPASSAVGSEGAASFQARKAIATIPATNAPIQPPAPPRDPFRDTLDGLDEAVERDEHGFTPGDRLIASMKIDRPLDESDVLERLERVRIQHILEETDQLVRQREHEQAVQILTAELETLEFDPSLFIIHHRLGTMLFRMQEYEAAAAHMERALEIQQDNAALASNLAAAQMTLGRLDEALETLSDINLRMIESPQLLFSIHFNLACLHSLKGNHDLAIENLFKAVDHDAPNTYASLGDTQLDPIRDDLRFRDLATALERHLGPNR